MTYQMICDDCLIAMDKIQDCSIDMVLCDLPYGVTRNKWDSVIPLDILWTKYNRLIKDNGVIVLTACQPFTSILIASNLHGFKYEWIWVKQQGTNFLNAKKQPLRVHESVVVFYNSQPTYNPQMTTGKPYKVKSGRQSDNYNNQNSVVTENDGFRYPVDVFSFNKDRDALHPTQKPIALFEYLIKTYTNEGDTVLDNCAGSFTTAVACDNLKRNWICIEKDSYYFNTGLKRINENRKLLNVEPVEKVWFWS